MTNLKAKLTSAITIASVVATAYAPAAFADTTIVISGNGKDSTSKVEVDGGNKTSISQSNSTYVVNEVVTDASTGGNKANGNTGGDVDITTGKITTDVVIKNGGSSNAANVDSCGCPEGDTTIKIKNNGKNSYNKVEVDDESKTKVYQKNWTVFKNGVGTTADTGYNKANGNTNGTTSVTTGKVKTKVKITNTGSVNTLNP